MEKWYDFLNKCQCLHVVSVTKVLADCLLLKVNIVKHTCISENQLTTQGLAKHTCSTYIYIQHPSVSWKIAEACLQCYFDLVFTLH